MISSVLTRTLAAAAIACVAFAGDARAQAQPSAASVALAREIIELKGGTSMFDNVIPGAVQYHKELMVQANPNLSKDLEEVANQLIKEFTPRRPQVHTEIARAYASRFTEQELKDAVAFYKTPLGRKLIVEEPQAIDAATKRVEAWASKYAEEVVARLRAEMKKKGHNLM